MGNLMRRPGGMRRGRRSALAVGLAALLLGITACGSDDDGGDDGGSGDTGAPRRASTSSSITDEAAQETVTKAMLTDSVAYGDLDPTVQESFKRATLELTPEQQDKAFECWSGTTCEIGDGDVTLGIAEAFGQNQWRKISKMEVILQALTYPEIGKIIFTDAQGDLATFQSNVRSLASQGATAIVSYNDFGEAALPAFKAAQAAGREDLDVRRPSAGRARGLARQPGPR